MPIIPSALQIIPITSNLGFSGVLYEDVIASGKAFEAHPQENMKIITLPLPGALKYLDSMCRDTTVRSTGFGSISRFIFILEILIMKYQLHIL